MENIDIQTLESELKSYNEQIKELTENVNLEDKSKQPLLKDAQKNAQIIERKIHQAVFNMNIEGKEKLFNILHSIAIGQKPTISIETLEPLANLNKSIEDSATDIIPVIQEKRAAINALNDQVTELKTKIEVVESELSDIIKSGFKKAPLWTVLHFPRESNELIGNKVLNLPK